MKILFSPEYAGNIFTQNGVMMDTVIVNTIGLIELLELRLGLHYEDIPVHERIAHYYDAVCKYMAANPDNVMAESFRIAGLNTAKAMLGWRDELRSADWKFRGAEISDRLSVLIGVEEYFCGQGGCDMTERLHIVTEQLKLQRLDCSDMTLQLACDKDLLKPIIRILISVLEQQGVKIEQISEAENTGNNLSHVRQLIAEGKPGKIRLDETDKSLIIYQFADERTACEYLSYQKLDDVDVWINTDNKQMDNWLKLMNKPMTGSVTADCIPQLTQLLVMGLGLFSAPLNVNTLIEWLNMPLHPLDKYFRSKLAESIVTEGGYRNDVCKQLIKDYIDGRYVYLNEEQKAMQEEEQQKIREKDIKKRRKMIGVFLPSLESVRVIKTDDVRLFVSELSSWSRQRAHLMEEDRNNAQWIEQLVSVASMCDALHILLGTITTPTIDYKTIDSWMSSIYEKGSYTNAEAERGCRIVVDAPAKLAAVAGKTIWIGVEGDGGHTQECAFLYPSEKRKLVEQHYICSWDDAEENCYHECMHMTPLRMTKDQLILVVCQTRGGEATLKHPLIVRLEQQVENIGKFIQTPKIDVENMTEVKVVENVGVSAEMKFAYADKLQWPDHLSPTTIGTLVEHPFDYLMERILNITADGKAQMADVKTTMGNVAHAVIEALFSPSGGRQYATPQEIVLRMENYETEYRKVVEAKGAILQLAENRLKEKLLHEQLRTCLDTLLEILRDNNLKVTGCEQCVQADLKLGLPDASDKEGNRIERDILGFIDMTLEDQDGHPVVFDFKWTTWTKGYQEKLESNRSIQLELYRIMLGQKMKDEVRRVAYFLMPDARLYSKEMFRGKHCTQIPSGNKDNIIEKLRQSVIYRKKQLADGIVETNGTYDELQYVKDTETNGLFPLEKDEETGMKEENFFSRYGLFKTSKIS